MFKQGDRVKYTGYFDSWKNKKGSVSAKSFRHQTTTGVLFDGEKDVCYPLTKNLEAIKEN
jgi:hypothetical protein